MSGFTNLRISAKVFSGFGIIITLLLAIASVGYSYLADSADNFQAYRSLALETNTAGRIQANLLETRMQAKNFVIEANDKSIEAVKERAAVTAKVIDDLEGQLKDPKRLEAVGRSEKAIKEYVAAFDVVTRKQAQRHDLVTGTLNVVGPEMEKKLSAFMEEAHKDGDTEGAYRAGLALRDLLLARLYVVKYLEDNTDASFQRTQKEFAGLEENYRVLSVNLADPERRRLIEDVQALDKRYDKAMEDVHAIIVSRNDIIENTLDRIGPEVASDIEEMKLAVKAEQDTLGPKALAAVETAKDITLAVSIFGALAGVLAAWGIGRGISRPIVNMTSAMGELASGNKRIEIPGRSRGDEIGLMAAAVQVFKDNMIKAEELAEQQRKEEEA